MLSLRCLWFIQFYFSNISYARLTFLCSIFKDNKDTVDKLLEDLYNQSGHVPYGMLNSRLNIGLFQSLSLNTSIIYLNYYPTQYFCSCQGEELREGKNRLTWLTKECSVFVPS